MKLMFITKQYKFLFFIQADIYRNPRFCWIVPLLLSWQCCGGLRPRRPNQYRHLQLRQRPPNPLEAPGEMKRPLPDRRSGSEVKLETFLQIWFLSCRLKMKLNLTSFICGLKNLHLKYCDINISVSNVQSKYETTSSAIYGTDQASH